MITYISGDLFESPAQVLVNTVNTVGVMGKGIALEFKRIYPEMFKSYRDHCERGEFGIGQLLLYKTPNKWILNFPTKKHWRSPSEVEYIEAGLYKLRASLSDMAITSIAFPELGCGNGELDFESQVKPLMEKYLKGISVPVFIYLSGRSPDPPEHKDTQSIAAWLRSEPTALPFDEVWEDLLRVLRTQNEFVTLAKGNRYRVHAGESSPDLCVESSGRKYRILQEELLDFWQQLRGYGLTHAGIAPEHRFASYLIPLFEKLPYVYAVELSDTSMGLKRNPAIGIQVLPPPISHCVETDTLFDVADYGP